VDPKIMRSSDATQIIGSPGTVSPVPKETRLPGKVARDWQADQLMPTRLASEQSAASVYGSSQPEGSALQSAQVPSYPPPLSSPSRSNARLFISLAAVLFVVVVGTAVVLFSISKPKGSQQSAPPSQPVQPVTPGSAPTVGADQPSIPPQPSPQQTPQGGLGKAAVDSSLRNALPNADHP